MKIYVSDFSDFCFGVKRAIRIVERTLETSAKPVYSLGTIIHNPEVVKLLDNKGLKALEGGIKDIRNGAVVICSHGIHPHRLNGINRQVRIVDATCPFVKNAQEIAGKLFRDGYKVVIIGDKDHPEVRSLKKFAGGSKASVVSALREARRFNGMTGKLGILAQTTQANKNFKAISSELLKRDFKEARIFNTICRDADMRQKAAERLSKKSGIMVVVGGRDSANTRRLYGICKKTGIRAAYHVENAGEINKKWFDKNKSIGVVSGASTPRWIVDEVVDKLSDIAKRKAGNERCFGTKKNTN